MREYEGDTLLWTAGLLDAGLLDAGLLDAGLLECMHTVLEHSRNAHSMFLAVQRVVYQRLAGWPEMHACVSPSYSLTSLA